MKNKKFFLVIGAQKAGTSWLWVNLRKHPQIWMPPIKEIHYFDYLYTEKSKNWAAGHIKQNVYNSLKWIFNNNDYATVDYSYSEYLSYIAHNHMFTEQWYKYIYLSRDSSVNKILGDITPEYSTISEAGIIYLKNLLPDDVKIIYLIRDPVNRALSQLRMNIERRSIDSNVIDKEQWLNLTVEEDILNRGDYKTYTPRWDKYFTREQILYLPYKLIDKNPKYILESVENFIGVYNFDQYEDLNNKIHVTRKITIPDFVREELLIKFADQYEYLNNKFDEEFLKSI